MRSGKRDPYLTHTFADHRLAWATQHSLCLWTKQTQHHRPLCSPGHVGRGWPRQLNTDTYTFVYVEYPTSIEYIWIHNMHVLHMYMYIHIYNYIHITLCIMNRAHIIWLQWLQLSDPRFGRKSQWQKFLLSRFAPSFVLQMIGAIRMLQPAWKDVDWKIQEYDIN